MMTRLTICDIRPAKTLRTISWYCLLSPSTSQQDGNQRLMFAPPVCQLCAVQPSGERRRRKFDNPRPPRAGGGARGEAQELLLQRTSGVRRQCHGAPQRAQHRLRLAHPPAPERRHEVPRVLGVLYRQESLQPQGGGKDDLGVPNYQPLRGQE